MCEEKIIQILETMDKTDNGLLNIVENLFEIMKSHYTSYIITTVIIFVWLGWITYNILQIRKHKKR